MPTAHELDARTLLPVSVDPLLEQAGPDEDPAFYLLGSLSIAGVPHSIQAFRMRWTDGLQETDTRPGIDYETLDVMADDVFEATYMDGPWNTVTLDGAEYALVITPRHNGRPPKD